MPVSTLDASEFERLYLGDRDLLRAEVDFRRGEARLMFSGAALASESLQGGVAPKSVELEEPVLVLSGLRGFCGTPPTAKPECIVLQWDFSFDSEGVVAELLVIGDPEPVTLRFECEKMHLQFR